MSIIAKLQKLLPGREITVDTDQSIVVKNIKDNASVYINSVVLEDFQQLRAEVQADNQALFDSLMKQLIIELNQNAAPKIKHFFKIDELKSSTTDNETLFKNNLAYFTREEIERHDLLIDYLINDGTALLLGYPATGKSIAVIDIAERLAMKGYFTYYHSFKKKDRWAEIWSEMIDYANANTIFVLDDIHLNIAGAAEAYIRRKHQTDLQILFISREVQQNINFTDTVNIYKELKNKTVKTEQPSIDEKVKGIVRNFQQHYQEKNKGSYPIGDDKQIIKNVHRNLIVLREYLKFWENYPALPLGALEEGQLYKNIYNTYFKRPKIKGKIRNPLLQYLCLYYYEIDFYANPKYEDETELLLTNASIVEEEGDLYSLYHGEYAFLLLKAYRFVQSRDFNKIGKTWQDFFYYQIKSYILDFQEEENYPNNLLELLVAIPRHIKEVKNGVKENRRVFQRLVQDATIVNTISEACSDERDDLFIIQFLRSVLDNDLDGFEKYYKAFGNAVFSFRYAFSIYLNAYEILKKNNHEQWLKSHCELHIPQMIETSSLSLLGQSLNSFNKPFPKDAIQVYQQINNDIILNKIKKARINEIGQALNELKNIDKDKTAKVYQTINNELLKNAISKARIHEIGNALNELKNIDKDKTAKVYQAIDNELLKNAISKARIHEIGNALNELKNIDKDKTAEIYQAIDNELLKNAISKARINEIGQALNGLKNIDKDKTAKVYQAIDNGLLITAISKARINEIGKALNELKNIDKDKTAEIYQAIDNELLKNAISKARINEIGQALIELKNVNEEKTKLLSENIKNDIFSKKDKFPASYPSFVKTVNEFSRVNPSLAKEIYDLFPQSRFFQWMELSNLFIFNPLVNFLINIDLDIKDRNFQKLVKFGLEYKSWFLGNRYISNIISYIKLMSKLNQDLRHTIQRKERHFLKLIQDKKNKKYVGGLIGAVYQHHPEIAINRLLLSYQIAFPDNQEVIAATYYFIGKNALEINRISVAKKHLKKATAILERIDAPDLSIALEALLEEYEMTI